MVTAMADLQRLTSPIYMPWYGCFLARCSELQGEAAGKAEIARALAQLEADHSRLQRLHDDAWALLSERQKDSASGATELHRLREGFTRGVYLM